MTSPYWLEPEELEPIILDVVKSAGIGAGARPIYAVVCKELHSRSVVARCQALPMEAYVLQRLCVLYMRGLIRFEPRQFIGGDGILTTTKWFCAA